MFRRTTHPDPKPAGTTGGSRWWKEKARAGLSAVSRLWRTEPTMVIAAAAAFVVAILALLLIFRGLRGPSVPPRPRLPYRLDYALLDKRDLLIEAQRKIVLGREQSYEHIQRVVRDVAPLVAESVRQPPVVRTLREIAHNLGSTVEDVQRELQLDQEADLLLESGGNPDAVSTAHAVGVAQWLAGTARRKGGLHVDEHEYARLTRRLANLRDSLQWLRSLPAGRTLSAQESAYLGSNRPLTRDEAIALRQNDIAVTERNRLDADERRDPRRAIFAQTRYLVRLWNKLVTIDWVFQAYHGGEKTVERAVKCYLGREWWHFSDLTDAIAYGCRGKVLSYEYLFGQLSPRATPDLFTYLYGKSDDHRHYWWKVLMARRSIAEYRRDPQALRRDWLALAPGMALDYAWYPNVDSMVVRTRADMDRELAAGRLVRVPDDLFDTRTGKLGPSPYHPVLRPQSLGVLYRIQDLFRQASGEVKLTPVRCLLFPAEITDWNHLKIYSTGLVFSLAVPDSSWQRKVLTYALDELEWSHRITAYPRTYGGRTVIHVCPNPQFAAEFLPPHRSSGGH